MFVYTINKYKTIKTSKDIKKHPNNLDAFYGSCIVINQYNHTLFYLLLQIVN